MSFTGHGRIKLEWTSEIVKFNSYIYRQGNGSLAGDRNLPKATHLFDGKTKPNSHAS